MTFDPNKPFEKVEQTGFDPNQPFETVDDEEVSNLPEYSPLESGTIGFVQGATFGFSDEMEAVVRSIFGNQDYDEALERARAKIQAAQEQNPGSYLTGEVGSFLVPGAAGAKVLGKGATLASKVARGALGGATVGAVEGIGRSEHDKLSGKTAVEAAKGAAIGGALGGATTGTMGLITKARPDRVRKLKQDVFLESAANRRRKLLHKEQYDAEIDKALEASEQFNILPKSIKPKISSEKMIEESVNKVKKSLEEVGTKIDDMRSKTIKQLPKFEDQYDDSELALSQLSQLGGKYRAQLAELQDLKTMGGLSDSEYKQASNLLSKEFNNLRKMYLEPTNVEGSFKANFATDTIEGLAKYKTNLYKRAGDRAFAIGTQPSWKQKVLKDLAKSLKELELDTMDKIGSITQDPKIQSEIADYKRNLELYSGLRKLEEKLVASPMSKDASVGFTEAALTMGADPTIAAGNLVRKWGATAAGRNTLANWAKKGFIEDSDQVRRLSNLLGVTTSEIAALYREYQKDR